MQETYSNDYSLLRPFDLEAAKRGEPLTTSCDHSKGKPVWKYTAGPDSNGNVVVTVIASGEFVLPSQTSSFAMAPLAWVEGKPVYKGDVLYWGKRAVTITGGELTARGPMLTGVPELLNGSENKTVGALPNNLTWTKPKQKIKKQIWINVYPEETFTSHRSKERAEYMADKFIRIACVPVEIEYEV